MLFSNTIIVFQILSVFGIENKMDEVSLFSTGQIRHTDIKTEVFFSLRDTLSQ